MATSAHPLNSNDQYILFSLIETFTCSCWILPNKPEKSKKKAYGLIFLDGKTRYYKDKVAS